MCKWQMVNCTAGENFCNIWYLLTYDTEILNSHYTVHSIICSSVNIHEAFLKNSYIDLLFNINHL